MSGKILSHKMRILNPIFIILCLALVVRILFIIGVVRGDDFDYSRAAYEISQGHQLNRNHCCGLNRVGIIYPVAALYALFGVNEWVTVAYPIFLSLVGVASIYGIGRVLDDEATGLIAALLWAVFPLDVFLSTQLLPDSMIANLSILIVLAGLWAVHGKKPISYLGYPIAGMLLVLAVNIKAVSFLSVLFLVTYIGLRAWGYLENKAVERWYQHNNVVWWMRFGLIIIIIGSIMLVFEKPKDIFLLLRFTATDIVQTLFLGSNPFSRVSYRDPIPDLWVLWFWITTAYLIMKREKKASPLFLWVGVMVLFSEFGVDVDVLAFPIKYLPPSIFYGVRHLLMFWPPILLIISLYLSKLVSPKATNRNLMLISSIVILVAFGIRLYVNVDNAPYLDVFLLFGSLASIASLIFLLKTESKMKWFGGSVVIFLLVLAEMVPVREYHSIYWQPDRDVMLQYQQAADFIKADANNYPIVMYRGGADRLDFWSGYAFGWNWKGALVDNSEARIIDSIEAFSFDQNAYVLVRRDREGEYFVQNNWWMIARFGEADDPKGQLQIYRYLSPDNAKATLAHEMDKLADDASPEDIVNLIGAAVNANDLGTVIESWNQLRALGVEQEVLPFAEIAPLFLAYSSQGDHTYQEINLSGIVGEQGLDVVLQPETLYVFECKVRAEIPIDLLVVHGGEIVDSVAHFKVYLSWTENKIVFITPAWEDGEREIMISFYGAEIDGLVQLQDVLLYAVALP